MAREGVSLYRSLYGLADFGLGLDLEHAFQLLALPLAAPRIPVAVDLSRCLLGGVAELLREPARFMAAYRIAS
jgi:hypothetical protein